MFRSQLCGYSLCGYSFGSFKKEAHKVKDSINSVHPIIRNEKICNKDHDGGELGVVAEFVTVGPVVLLTFFLGFAASATNLSRSRRSSGDSSG